MTVNSENDHHIKKQAEKILNENLMILLEDNTQEKCSYVNDELVSNSMDELPIYFR